MNDVLLGFLLGAGGCWLTLFFSHIVNVIYIRSMRKALQEHNEAAEKAAIELIEKAAAATVPKDHALTKMN